MKRKRIISFFIAVFLLCTFLITNKFGFEISKSKAAPLNTDNKIIYLTFDDGPSYNVTNKVLDILKENNVKATFFLIGNQIDGLEDVVKRIHKEGHIIGLHTYSHKIKKVYSIRNSFINEMLQCREKINAVVGVSPSIIRFPGGSYKRLSETFLTKLHSYNFKVYDWNMVTSDGLKQLQKILLNSISL